MPGLLAALALGLGGAATQPAAITNAAIDNPVYVCIVRHSDPQGTLIMGIRINNEPRRFDSLVRWTSAPNDSRLSLSLLQGYLDLEDYSAINISVTEHWRGNPRVRIVLSRNAAYGTRPWDIVFGTGYRRYPSGDAYVTARLAELRAFAAGSVPVRVSVLNRRNEELATAALDPARIEAMVAAVAAARGELETMAADYRNRCPQRPAAEGLRF